MTLNRHSRNRGLGFGEDMHFYCGGSYRVAAKIDRIVHEGTGELLQLKTPSILLESVTGIGGIIINPQNEFYYWREIWLEPEPMPADISSVGRAPLVPAASIESGTSVAPAPDKEMTKT